MQRSYYRWEQQDGRNLENRKGELSAAASSRLTNGFPGSWRFQWRQISRLTSSRAAAWSAAPERRSTDAKDASSDVRETASSKSLRASEWDASRLRRNS